MSAQLVFTDTAAPSGAPGKYGRLHIRTDTGVPYISIGTSTVNDWKQVLLTSNLGTGVATFLATPSSANLRSAVTDETGTGALVFANTPTLVTPVIGAATGTSLVVTGDVSAGASSQHLFTGRGGLSASSDGNFEFLAADTITPGVIATGTIPLAQVTGANIFKTIAVSGQSDVVADSATDTLTLVAGSNVTITTNATTDTITIASSGGGGGGDALVANPLSQFAATTSLQLKNTISDETGSGALVFANTPTLVTPVLGAATGTSVVLSADITVGASSQLLVNGRGGLSASSNGNFELLATDGITPGALITGTVPAASLTGTLAVNKGGTGQTTAQAAYNALMIHGADIASASTVDLDAATGDCVDITGTTTITAVTLADGKERTVRFTGALVLTNGASLVLPGGVNRTTVAGDYAVFRGYSAGVVRCTNYSKITVTGSGGTVQATNAVLVTPALGTPQSGVLTNCTGTAAGLTAGNVTTNANLTGPITSSGNATSVTADAITNAMLADMATLTIKGNNTGSTANPVDMTVAQLVAMFPHLCTKTLDIFNPIDNEPPATNYATLISRNNHPALAFDTTTQETAIFRRRIKQGTVLTNGITVFVQWAATSATSGTIGWDVSFERLASAGQDLDSDNWGSAQTITATTVSGTSGTTLTTSVNFSQAQLPSSLAAGDMYRVRVRRDVANDNATGDAELYQVEIQLQ